MKLRVPSPYHYSLRSFAILLLINLAGESSGQTSTWTGAQNTGSSGARNLWSTAGNWSGTAIAGGNALIFTGNAKLTTNSNDFANGTAFASITFDANAGAFVLSGNQIALGSAGLINDDTLTQTINLALSLANATTFNANAGALTVGGAISGAGGITKTGANTVTLSGTNSYTGVTTITEGILSVATIGNGGVAGNLGQASTAAGNLVLNGGTLQYTGLTATTNRNFTLSAGTSSTINVTTNTLTISGASVASTGALTKAGAGTLILSGANLHTGTTTVAAGTLSLSGAGSLAGAVNLSTTGAQFNISAITPAGISLTSVDAVAGTTLALGAKTLTIGSSNAAATIAGAITGAGGGLTKTGTNTLTLSGTNTYTGATTLQAGTLVLNSANALGGNGSISFTGGTLRYSANNTSDLSGRLTLGSGTIRLDTNGQNVTWASAISATQSGGLEKSGLGTLTLNGANAYTGTTTLTAGSIALGSNTALGTSSIALNGGSLVASGAARTLSNGITVGAASTLDTAALGLSLSGNITTSAASDLTLTGSSNGLLSGTISQTTGNPLNLVKAGSSTWTIRGNNSFAGQTTLNAGTLRLENANALGTRAGADTVTLAGGNWQLAADSSSTFGAGSGFGTTITGNSTITLDRLTSGAATTTQIGGLTMGAQTLTLARGANVTSGTAKLVISGASSVFNANPIFDIGSGTELHFGSNMTGAVNLTKNGAGIMTMGVGSGLANFTVNAGQLNINWFQGLGTAAGTLTLANGVTLDNTSAGSVTVANPKSITLGATSGSGTLNFLGTQSLGMGSGTVTLTGNTTFNVAANTLTFGGDVTGAFGIIKTGAGTLELTGLSGTSSFTGNTQINAGTLFLNGSSTFANGTTVTVNNGGTLRVGPSAQTQGATVVLNGGSQIIEGTVNANLTFGTNTVLDSSAAAYNGTVTIQNGVTVTTASDLLGTIPGTPTTSRVVIENGATLAASQSFTINQNKGIQIGTSTGTASGSATFSSALNAQLFLTSSISGDAALIKTGAGNIRLIADNSYRGGTVINQGIIGFFDDASLGLAGTSVTLNNGTLVAAAPDTSRLDSENKTATIGSTRNVILGAGTTNSMDAQTERVLVYNGVISESSGVANMEFNLAGTRTGIIRLGGLNNYSGTTTVEAGVMEITHFGNGGVASGVGDSSNAASNLVIGGATAAATLRYTGTTTATSNRLFTLGIGGGTLDGGNQGMILTNAGAIALNGTSARSLTLAGSGNSSLAATLADAASGASSLIKNDSGTWTLSGNNTYTGGTVLNAGTISINSANAIGSGKITFNGGTLAVTNTMTLNNALEVNTNSAGVNILEGNTLSLLGTVTGSNTLFKEGLGILRLGNTNDFTGATTLTSGTVEVDSIGNGGQSSGIGASSNAAENLVFDGGALRFTGQANVVSDRSFVIKDNKTAVIDVDNAAANLSLAGATGNATNGSLTKRGNGKLTITGINTNTGVTRVEAGSLVVNGSLASSSIIVDGSLGGSGTMANATLSGSGSVGPGNSPGIMTVGSVDPTGGIDFNFEFTVSNGMPEWNQPSNSGNDVLRLTDNTAFTQEMTSGNVINIFLNLTSIKAGDVFTGGFFTDTNSDFKSMVQNASFNYYLKDDAGSTAYASVNYTLYSGPLTFLLDTTAVTANFTGTDVAGRTLQFTAVPETTVSLLGAMSSLLLLRRKRPNASR